KQSDRDAAAGSCKCGADGGRDVGGNRRNASKRPSLSRISRSRGKHACRGRGIQEAHRLYPALMGARAAYWFVPTVAKPTTAPTGFFLEQMPSSLKAADVCN